MVKQYMHYVGLNILSEERRVTKRGVVSSLIKNCTEGKPLDRGKSTQGNKLCPDKPPFTLKRGFPRQKDLTQSTANQVVHCILG